MTMGPRRALMIALCGGALACGGSTSTPPGAAGAGVTMMPAAGSGVVRAGSGAAGGGGPAGAGGAGSAAPAGSASPSPAGAGGQGASGGSPSPAGSGGSAAGSGAAGASGAAGGGGAAGGTSGGSGNMLTGMLGALGPVQPVMAGFAITNGPETIVYLSSAPLTCAQMMMGGVKWLSTLPAKSQVIEMVVPGTASAKTYMVGNFAGEVHYAEGSKSSSTEATASSGSIVYTKASKGGVHEGMVNATFPMGSLMGTFHAEWCQGGTEF